MKAFKKKVYPKPKKSASAVGKEGRTKELSKDSKKAELSITAVDIYEVGLDVERIVQ